MNYQSSKNTLVVLPSYNEKENIVSLIEALLAQDQKIHVCVVDDMSPDKTYELVKNYIDTHPQIKDRTHLIIRSKKDGRGGAVRDGFEWGYKSDKNFETYIEMDCDFSHEPKALKQGLELIEKGSDVILGSRYPDGKIVGWPLKRHVLSFCANFLARSLINWKISDYTNGFRFYNKKAVSVLMQNKQKYKGYIYLSESLSQLINSQMKIASFPIYFVNRERGVSNTSFAEVKNAFLGIFTIAWNHHKSRK